jgi:hypothetical protein
MFVHIKAMIILTITLVGFLLLRAIIFSCVPANGVELLLDGCIYSVSKGALTIGLWAFVGFPAIVISLLLLWECRKSRAEATSEKR